MIHPIQRAIVPPLLKLLWIKEINGIENIPSDGRFVVTPNHQSFFDDWIVPSVIIAHLDKELHMYVNRSYFRNPIFRLYMDHHGCIPVEVHNSKDKKKVNEKAFQKALFYLGKGEPTCIYPEGHRSVDGELQKAKYGAAKLALTARIPVLPVGIIGSGDVLQKGKVIPKVKRQVKVYIGKPIYLDKYYGKENNKKVLKETTTIIMKSIGKLIGKRYRY